LKKNLEISELNQYGSETLIPGFATSGSTEVAKTQRILNQLETALFFFSGLRIRIRIQEGKNDPQK
jgi:hypothetical protein